MNKYLRRFLMLAGFILLLAIVPMIMYVVTNVFDIPESIWQPTGMGLSMLAGFVIGHEIGPKIERKW